jgi:maleate isomerase
MQQYDGWSAPLHLGVVVPEADIGPEAELQAMLRTRGTVHGSRVAFSAMRADGAMDPKIPHQPVLDFTRPPHIDDAVRAVALAPVHGVGLAFTSSSYVHGAAEEQRLLERLRTPARDLPLTTTCRAAVAACRAMGIRRLALFNPPWFDDVLNEAGRTYFAAHEITVTRSEAVAAPSIQMQVTPERLIDDVVANIGTAEAIFVAGNGQRAVAAIERIEHLTGRPVFTANQVLLWNLLPEPVRLEGYGSLFDATRTADLAG